MTDMEKNALLQARSLCVEIGGKTVCRNFSWHIQAGESWAILGANGVGKTTLLHTMAGLRSPVSGEVRLRGVAIETLTRKQVARTLGLLLQDSEDAFPSTVIEAALSGRHPHLGRLQWESVDDERIAMSALQEVGLESMAARSIQTLSGGERRLLGLATLMVQAPSLYMLDEPNNHLDLHRQIATLDLVSAKVRGGECGAIMILHDVNLAMRYCDHVILLHGAGEIEQGVSSEVLFEQSVSRLYGHGVAALQGPRSKVFVPL